LLPWWQRPPAFVSGYDAAIAADAAAASPAGQAGRCRVLTGANHAAFNFGANSGDATMESSSRVILPSAAERFPRRGANASSSLRYETVAGTATGSPEV